MEFQEPIDECQSEPATQQKTPFNIPDLLESPEAFKCYLDDVKIRRITRRQQRHRVYLENAVEQLKEELQASEQEQDVDLVTELRAVIAAFQLALDSLDTSQSEPPLVDRPVPLSPLQFQDSQPADSILENPKSDSPISIPNEPVALSFSASVAILPDANLSSDQQPKDEVMGRTINESDFGPTDEAMEGVPEHAVRLSLAYDADQLSEWIDIHLEVGITNRGDAMLARALFCKGQALSFDPDAPPQGHPRLLHQMEALTQEMQREGSNPFGGSLLSPQSWDSLSDLYQSCVVASNAMDWYEANEEFIPEHSKVDLLNAIAAANQRLYRRPESIIRRDTIVQGLYLQIRTAAQKAAFVRALSSHATDAELATLAQQCTPLFESTCNDIEEQQAQAERQAQKDAAINAVIAWEEAREGSSITIDSIDAEREQITALLNACLKAGVPATNTKVRTALLDVAPILLEGQMRYAKFLEAVLAERTRRQMDAIEVAQPEETIQDQDLDQLADSVVAFTRGKRLVILGGKSRPQVPREIGQHLECNATWPDSDRGDKFSKFSTTVKKADIVLMLKNFASHELFYGCKEAMAGQEKHFVVLPSGYGVKQVIYQLSKYVGREKVLTA